jgi:hypothetical protein
LLGAPASVDFMAAAASMAVVDLTEAAAVGGDRRKNLTAIFYEEKKL